METSILKKAAKFLKGRKKYAAAMMGVLVITAVGFETARPAFTMEREVYCGLEEHVHTAECYGGYQEGSQENTLVSPVEKKKLNCTVTGSVAHTHENNCYGEGGDLVCPLAEKEAHTHRSDCYEQGRNLTCGMEELEGHAHGDECYAVTKNLICGQEEAEGHTHNDSCYTNTQELTCTENEAEGHSHGDSCYDADGNTVCGMEESGGHSHGEGCYTSVDTLNCGKEETEGHTHTEECYEEVGELICGKEEVEGHTHTDSCYEGESKLICGKEELEEHIHGDECFSGAENEAGTGNGDNTWDAGNAGETENGMVNPGEGELICGKEEHVHTEECYDLGLMLLAEGLLAEGEGWALDTDGLLTIQGTENMKSLNFTSETQAPWYEYRDEVVSVQISGINTIAQAFKGYKKLESVEILGDSVWIGDYSFSECSALKEIIIEPVVTGIGLYAFQKCYSLESIDIQVSNNPEIKNSAFESCSALNSVIIRGDIKDIGYYAFRSCGALEKFEITGGMEGDIRKEAFKSCSSLVNITIPNGVRTIGSSAFMFCSSLASIDIPDTVRTIESDAFYKCKALIDVVIPNSVESIRYRAFTGCAFTNIIIPDGVSKIEWGTFEDCTSLTDITIPASVESIGSDAFKGCTSLKKIELPENISKIEVRAFSGCTELTDITIPASVESIESDAFKGCTSLKKIELPENISKIEVRAFSGCTGLSSITIPANAEKMGNEVFSGCSSLESVVLEARNMQVGTGAFPGNVKELIIQCDSVETIKAGLPSCFKSIDVLFKGQGFFELEEPLSLGIPARNKLNAGKYFADGNGALYLIKEDGASLAYVPAGKEEYTVLSDIPAQEGGENRKVISVLANALKMADGLERLIFASAENIQTLPGYSCGNCPSLESVNGYTTVDEVLALFNKDAQISPLAFYNTGLGGKGQGSPFGDDIAETIILNGVERDLFRISTAKNENGEREFYTNQEVKTTVSVSNPSNQNPYSILRCYVAFDDATGKQSYPLGSYTFKTKNTDGEDGSGCRVDVGESDAAYIYYFDIYKPREGDALQFDFKTVYPSPTSAGGTARIWAVPLSQEEWEKLGNDVIGGEEKYHQITWGTKADSFPVSKEPGTKKTPVIQGDGKEEGIVTVRDLQYEISMNREGDTELSIGKDHMLNADFTDTFTLPEGAKWRDGLLEAVRNGQYRWKSVVGTSSYTHTLYVTINGEEYMLLKMSGGRSSAISVERKEFSAEEDSVEFGWRVTNKDVEKEINLPKITVEFGSDIIFLDGVLEGNAYEFHNRVYVKQHFSYSLDQESESETVVPVTASEAKIEISKSHEKGLVTQWLGNDINFKIAVKNSGGLPGRGLDNVTDSLPNRFYIKPEKMESLVSAIKNGEVQGVQELDIQISNATLCLMNGSGDYIPGKGVTGTDGNEYVLSHNNSGIGTRYEGKETSETVADKAAKINISYSKDNGLTMNYTSNGEKKELDGSDIGKALEGIGYTVTSRDAYTVTWKFSDDYALHSGMTKEFELPATIKDSFMWASVDTKEHLTQSSASGFWADYNRAYVYDKEGNKKSSSCEVRTNYEFNLNKSYSVDGGQETKGETVGSGDILTYSLNVSHKGTGSYDILPLVDRMQGAQVLMVPVEGNEVLSGYGLDTEKTADETEYYLLSRAGIYEGVMLGGSLTESIVVEENANGLDTIIRWYLTELNSGGNLDKTLSYRAKVDTSRGELGATYSLSNKSWLNDHQTHRLYDEVFLTGSDLTVDKNIVTSLGETPDGDELEKYSIIGQGDKVTYRLRITNVGGKRTVKGGDLYDILPRTSGFVWCKNDNIEIRYVGAGSEDTCVNGESWEIVGSGISGIQKIQWKEDFQLTISGTMYIYVTLTYPTGSEWQAYASDKMCAAERLENTFYCYAMNDTVYHDLAVGAEAYLQKGVYESTGITSEDSRKYYGNSIKDKTAIVIYYVAIYNSGSTRLYLNEIQDRLPRGFTYINKYISSDTHYERRPNSLTMADGTVVKPNWVRYFNTDQRNINEDGSLIGFNLSKGNLKYDDLYKKYYLAPNEAVSFSYQCKVGNYGSTDVNAVNSVAMPYTDVIGGGLEVPSELTMKGAVHTGNRDMVENDGGCYRMSTGDAVGKGFSVEGEASWWLASDVKLERGNIQPGINKKVASITKGGSGNVETDQDHANATDTINWEVTVTNSGQQGIYNYTLTDVMETPYAVTGEVSYERKDSQSQVLSSEKLFRVDGHTVEGKKNCLILFPVNNYSAWSTDFGGVFNTSKGQPLHLPEGNVLTISNRYKVTFSVNEKKEEELSITVTDHDYSILPGGSGILKLSTKNAGTDILNKTYYNGCYITPEEQPYDGSIVNQGIQTEWKGMPSVYNRAQILVTYGDMTSSVKRVTEIKEPGSPENSASSDGKETSITLPSVGSTFRYTLEVNNTVANGKPMEELVLIDSLPEVGDHSPFNDKEQRFSKFKVRLTDSPEFAVYVETAENQRKTIDPGQYSLEYNTKTRFMEDDWGGRGEGWTKTLDATVARAFRIVIKDTGAADSVIPAGAKVIVEFNGQIAGALEDGNDGAGEAPTPGTIAWNSFGYRCKLKGSLNYLEATPLNVGVRTPDVPRLTKHLVDEDGNETAAREEGVFRFLIYEGGALALKKGYTEEELAQALVADSRAFTYVELRVEKGQTQSEMMALNGLEEWRYEEGEWVATGTAWNWQEGDSYTIVELPLDGEGIYKFYSLGGSTYNSYTFTHSIEQGRRIHGVNSQKKQEIFELPESGGIGTWGYTLLGALCLAGAGLLLYGKAGVRKMRRQNEG